MMIGHYSFYINMNSVVSCENDFMYKAKLINSFDICVGINS